jgi:hypothetical protein
MVVPVATGVGDAAGLVPANGVLLPHAATTTAIVAKALEVKYLDCI